MACYSVATTSALLQVTLTPAVAQNLFKAVTGYQYAPIRDDDMLMSIYHKGWRLIVNKNTGRVFLESSDWSILPSEIEEKFQSLLVQAQKAVVLQKLQAAGKVESVKQVKGGTTMKVTVR